MGYQPTRFIDRIHVEFLCSICDLVVANPVQSSACQHLYCSSCIKGWLALNQSCPDDHVPLKIEQLEPAPRLIQSLLNKLRIMCDFRGCEAVVKLEDLQKHNRNCNYNPNAEIICDRGCNIKMSRHEYNTTTCIDHHKAEIEQLFASACSQQSNYPMTSKDDNALRPIDEYILQQCDVMDVVEDKKWHVFHNMKESADQEDHSNILECDNKSPYAFAQSFSCLDTTNSSFRIKIVNLDCVKYVAVGVTSKGHPIDKLPGLHMGSMGYDSIGDLIVDNKSKNVDLQWKVGDIIECGIKFPSNCTNDSNTGAMLYFSRNKKIVAEESIKMPSDGYFPTIYMYEGIVGSMWGSGNAWSSNTSTKIKYFTN